MKRNLSLVILLLFMFMNGNAQTFFYHEYEGSIDRIKVKIELVRTADSLEGNCRYLVTDDKSHLKGFIVNDSVFLTEYSQKENSFEWKWKGKLFPDQTFSGTCYNKELNDGLEFSFREISPPRDIGFDYYEKEKFIRPESRDGSMPEDVGANFRMAFLDPVSSTNPKCLALLRDSLRKMFFSERVTNDPVAYGKMGHWNIDSLISTEFLLYDSLYRATMSIYKDSLITEPNGDWYWDWNTWVVEYNNSDGILCFSVIDMDISANDMHNRNRSQEKIFDVAQGKFIYNNDIFIPGYEGKLTQLLRKKVCAKLKLNEAKSDIENFGVNFPTDPPSFIYMRRTLKFSYGPPQLGKKYYATVECTLDEVKDLFQPGTAFYKIANK